VAKINASAKSMPFSVFLPIHKPCTVIDNASLSLCGSVILPQYHYLDMPPAAFIGPPSFFPNKH
jgi:hypothetical protein